MTVAEGIEIVFIPSLSERITLLYSIRMKCTLLVPNYVLEHCSIAIEILVSISRLLYLKQNPIRTLLVVLDIQAT